MPDLREIVKTMGASEAQAPGTDFGPLHIEGEGLDAGVSIPSLEQGYTSPYAQRNTNIGQNIPKDIKQFGDTMTALAGIPMLRYRESFVGDKPLNYLKALVKNPADAWLKHQTGAFTGNEEFGQLPMVRGSDLTQAVEAGKEAAAYYWNEYLKPLQDFDKMGYKNPAEYYIEHFEKAPLSTFLDLGLGKPTKAIGQTAKLAGKAGLVPVPHAMAEFLQGQQVRGHLRTVLRDLDNKRLTQLREAQDKLSKLWTKLPAAWREAPMVALAEKTDAGVERLLGRDPGALRALAEVRRYANEIEKILKIPEHIRIVTQYGPAYLVKHEKARRDALAKYAQVYKHLTRKQRVALLDNIRQMLQPLRFEDLFPEAMGGLGTHYKNLLKIASEEKALGKRLPVYAAILGKEAQGVILDKAMTKPLGGGIHGRLKLAAKVAGKEVKNVYEAQPEERAGMALAQRRRDAKALTVPYETPPEGELPDWSNKMLSPRKYDFHSFNLKDLTLARYAEAKQYEMLRDFITNLRKMAVEPGPKAAYVDLGKALEDVAKEFTQEDMAPVIAALPPGERFVWLPKAAADALNKILAKPMEKGVPGKVLSVFNRQYTTGLFGLDYLFGTLMGIRTAVIQGYSVRNLKDLAALAVAYKVAAHPEAASKLPSELLLSHAGGHADPNLLRVIDKGTHPNPVVRAGARFVQAIQKGAAAKSELEYGFHNYQRRASAIAYLLYRADEVSPRAKKFIADAFDTSAALEEATQKTFSLPELKKLHDHLTGTLGDYSSMAYEDQRAIQAVFPIWAWVRHAYNLAKTLPTDHPYKTAILSSLNQVPQQLGAEEHGHLPVRGQSGEIQRGPSGGLKYFYGPSLDPLMGGFELGGDIAELAFPQGEGYRIPSSLNPVAQVAAEKYTGLDLTRHKQYGMEHPDWKRVWNNKEKKYEYVDRRTGERHGESSTPDFVMHTAQRLYPKQTRQAMAAMAYPQVATPWTSPSDKAGKKRGKRRLTADENEMLLEMFGLGAHEH